MEVMDQVKHHSHSTHRYRLYMLFGFLAALYFILIYLTNPASALLSTHLGADNDRLVSLLLRLPLELIWLVVLLSYLRLDGYVNHLGDNKDGRHFAYIKNGLLALSIGMPALYVLNNLWVLLLQHDVISVSFAGIATTYSQLIVTAIAILLIARGTNGINRLAKGYPLNKLTGVLLFVGIAVGASFCFLVANNVSDPSAAPSINNVWHYLPAWAVIYTLVVPYLFLWTLGVRSIYEFIRYQHFVKGNVYRRALRNLTAGFATVIFLNIALQFITTLSRQSLNLSRLTLFCIAYIIYAIMCLGYILIATGAGHLQKIEEV
ncbi:MAG: hypothetical protein JWM37_266 [Candidatus Saccharibacteria bacterium]|nr:hypothetical protein [Candidatus Saccharibacteria bacterium]